MPTVVPAPPPRTRTHILVGGRSSQLEELDLSENLIGVGGAHAVARVAIRSSNLKRIRLVGCRLQEDFMSLGGVSQSGASTVEGGASIGSVGGSR